MSASPELLEEAYVLTSCLTRLYTAAFAIGSRV